jgi:hypothetical protein
MKTRGAALAGTMVAVVATAGCAPAARTAAPDQRPEPMAPTQAAYSGWCYNVQSDGWSPSLVDRFPELEGFSMPKVVYLGPEAEHGSMAAGIDTGREELFWSDAREARWMGETPFDNEPWAFDHAHWWQMDDGSYRIGFAGSYLFWVGFEATATENGLEGTFRYWSLETLGEGGEPEVEFGAALDLVDCIDTPLVVIDGER